MGITANAYLKKGEKEYTMPAWILSALRMLAGGFAGGAAFAGGSSLVSGPEQYPGQLRPRGADIEGDWMHIGGHPRLRRRRRRRVLTSSDRADIAFVAGMISKAAAKEFAVVIAARV